MLSGVALNCESLNKKTMHVTRPLSKYSSNPESLSIPLECPNSGYIVIPDKESEIYSCFGLFKEPCTYLDPLPFPQNKNLTIRIRKVFYDVILFPVLINHCPATATT